MDFLSLSQTHTHTHTHTHCLKLIKERLITLRTIPNAMFYTSGCGLPLLLASPLHTPGPPDVPVVFQHQVLPVPGPLHLLLPLSGTLFHIHFHLNHSSHPSGFCINVNAPEMSSLPGEAFSHSDLSYSSSSLSFSSMERN